MHSTKIIPTFTNSIKQNYFSNMSEITLDEIKRILSASKEFLSQHEELYGSDYPNFNHIDSVENELLQLKTKQLTEFFHEIKTCMRCSLGSTRKNFVFGDGNPNAKLMVIGEAPGADEDDTGHPFVGRAGQLLTAILKSVGFSRSEVFICNILKCRPPQNRKPLPDEVVSCSPYLHRQIDIIQPKLILALGTTAANTLLDNQETLTDMRGKVHEYRGVPMIVTFHPAALLRNPNWKVHTWQDIQKVRKMYDDLLGHI